MEQVSAGHHPLYPTWQGMLWRCYKPQHKGYKDYGGRGIVVCDEWREDFWTFVADVGDKPEGYSLNRIDNDGPYSKDNCEWAPREVQDNTKRNNVWIKAFEETKTLSQWSRDERCIVPLSTLASRIQKNRWEAERALTTPKKLTPGRPKKNG